MSYLSPLHSGSESEIYSPSKSEGTLLIWIAGIRFVRNDSR